MEKSHAHHSLVDEILNGDKRSITTLIKIMVLLRDPENGCPWDKQQTFSSIAPFTIEEAYEVYDAISKRDLNALKDELGDVLFQVIFHSQLAKEQSAFTFADVTQAIIEKMIRRHPHVFGESAHITASEVDANWEKIKRHERATKNDTQLGYIASALPALSRALKLSKKAAQLGFDWQNINDIFAKIDEEITELKTEITPNPNQDRLEDELGDVLFCLVNLARHLSVDPEQALRRANTKFSQRFEAMAQAFIDQGQKLDDQSLEQMEQKWQLIKQQSRKTT